MTDFPARGQQAPDYWDTQLKAYIGEQVAAAVTAERVAATLDQEPVASDLSASIDQRVVDGADDLDTPIGEKLGATFQRKSPAASVLALPTPWIMAHRCGGGSAAPEATLTAAEVSIASGAHAIEYDPRYLADGTQAIMHDDTTTRTTGVTANVEELNAAVWRQLDAAGGFPWWPRFEPAPYIEDFLTAFGGKVVQVPTPKEGVESTDFFDTIKARGLQDSFLFVTRSLSVLQYIKANGGYCGYSYNGAPGAGGRPSVATLIANGADLITIGFAAAGIDDTIVQAVIDACAMAGIHCGVWTMNRRYERDKYIAMGATCIITDQPGYLATSEAVSTIDPFRFGSLGAGLVSSANNPANPSPPTTLEIRDDGALITRSVTSNVSYLLGSMSPMADYAGSFTIDFHVGFETVPGTPTTASVGLLFGAEDDRGHTFNSGSYRPGFWARIRGDGAVQLWKYTDATTVTQLGSNLATVALSADQLAHLRLTVTPTNISLTRIDGDTYTPISVSDSTRLGGYLAIGRQNTTVPTIWKGIEIS